MLCQLYNFLAIALAVLKKQIVIQPCKKNKFASNIDTECAKSQKSIKNISAKKNAVPNNICLNIGLNRHIVKIFKVPFLNFIQPLVSILIANLKITHQTFQLDLRSISIDCVMKSRIQDGA